MAGQRRDLAEVIVSCGLISQEDLACAKENMPPDTDLGEHLFANGWISDEDLCRATSLSTGVPAGRFDPSEVKSCVRCSLPAHLERKFGVVPVELRAGHLTIAGQQVPSSAALAIIKGFTSLAIDFQLVTRRNYSELQNLVRPC